VVPISVNYHFTRKCNLACGFCFHVAKTSYIERPERAKRGLRLLKEAGMRKINFAGGEPFLYPKFLGPLLRYCKEDLRLESVSIVTNGTKVTEEFLKKYGMYIDILAVSCDSFNESINREIGRVEPGKEARNVEQLRRVSEWCRTYGIKFKLNTVICRLNWQEDMASAVQELNPFRWKVFQVLLVESENDATAKDRKGDFDKFYITDAQFETFCQLHKHLKCFVPESNRVMKSSYLILDEYLRFLDKGDGKETTSECILDVGVAKALQQVRFDQAAFHDRGAEYDWSRIEGTGPC
ncbi:radical SAM enzyme, partial [Lepidopterella palustris CBS 459.81]